MFFKKNNKYTICSSSAGFSLIELMITIVVMTILLAVAIPSMQSFIAQNRLSGNANEFIAATMLARSEAIKRGGAVKICRSVSADVSSTITCDTSDNDWKTGWLVLVENSSDSTKNEVLARQGTLVVGTTVTPTSTATTPTSIVYNAMGAPTQAPPSTFAFAFNGQSRSVCFDPSGRARAC
ncbi:GspH/FimT family pseudopilin [Collimonas antrihumi]|uniref:GspH/FimT family pseudopilin n=1 Tax=Collimonas antrihumi TaxID=1940615 RepID=UPI001B8CCFA5